MGNLNNVPKSVFVQKFRIGDACTGVAHTGTSKVHSTDGRQYTQGFAGGNPAGDGGLFDFRDAAWGDSSYALIRSFLISIPGATSIAVLLVDEDGVEYPLVEQEEAYLTMDMKSPYAGWPMLPGWKFRVVAGGVASGAGKAVVIADQWTAGIPSLNGV